MTIEGDGPTRRFSTPTGQLQPFECQRMTGAPHGTKMPPISTRLRSDGRKSRTSSNRHITGQRHPRARHRAVVVKSEGPSGLGRRSRAAPLRHGGQARLVRRR